LQDKVGNFWFGTLDGGVSKYDGKSFTNYTTAQGLADNRVWSMMEDRAGNIWFATDKGGASKYDGKNFIIYTTAQGLASNSVVNISQDNAGNIWFGTHGGASKFDGKSFANYTTAQGLPGNNIQGVIQDKEGNLWFATHDDGVSKYDGNRFTGYTTAQGLVSNKVYSLLKDKAENIWVGTNAGVSRYDGKNFTNYTTEQGLADNYIWAMVEDQQRDMIWFGTNQGLSGFKEKGSTTGNTQDNRFENFNKNTGYPIKGGSSLLVDNKGIVWVGIGHNELIRFDYSAVSKNTEVLNLKIGAVKVNNEPVCWNNLLRKQRGNKTDSLTILNEMITSFGKALSPAVLDSTAKKYAGIQLDGVSRFYPVPINLVLPDEYNNITIDFVAIEPALQKQVKYQYKLEGYSKDWSPLSNNSTAVFGNMPAGNYTFMLKAVSPFGVWSQTQYSFKVLPPWWATWWAYILYALFIGSVGYTLYRNRINGLKRKQAEQIKAMVATQEEERKRISRDLHDDVGTKLSALKLFVSALHEKASETNNEEIKSLAISSEQFITEAVQDVRQLLQNLSPAVLEEFGYITAVEGLVNKINETKQLHFNLVIFGLKIGFKKEYDLALYRITQELINNVLKHAEAKYVSLQIGQRDEKIILMIEDDGKGFDVSSHKDGYGMHNLEARTKLLHGVVTIDSQPGKGTSVLIEIPYII
ncbi:MAG: histidine kinase, partial [Bacteroidota bacterium]|nr:histidine kinase [Bacteroidota bacterium]